MPCSRPRMQRTIFAMPKIQAPEEWTLSNGVPVIVQNQDAPVAATYWWVRTGSADESLREAGFAHFLEHMLFKDAAAKDSGKASTGQMAQAIESLGGDINAYTSFDQTVYHVTCAAHHWEKVLDQFGQMAKPQRFLKQDFTREREVILEELAKNNDSPGRQLFQSIFTSTFARHPYGRPVIGYPRTLKAARVKDLEAFYRRNYVAQNMGVILVGPFGEAGSPRRKAVFKLLEKRFGRMAIPRGKPAKPAKRPAETELRAKPTLKLKPFDVKTPTLAMSFRVPELTHEDVPALDILASALGSGELSRLYQRLFYKDSLVTEASGGLYVPNDPGMMYFQAELVSLDNIEPAAKAMLEELTRMRDDGPTREEIARVVVNTESERLYATQTADGMASRLGFLRFSVNDMQFDDRYLEALRDVDVEKVKAVARKYLDPRRMSLCLLYPKDATAPRLAVMSQAAEKVLRHPVVKKAIATKAKRRLTEAAGPEILVSKSGVRVVFRPNPTSHVVSVHASVFGGLRSELAAPVETRDRDWGAGHMMSLTWTKGTHKGPWGPARSAQEISHAIEGRASSMDAYSGRNTAGLQLTGLARDWNDLSKLFAESWLAPAFLEEEVAHSRRVAEDSVRGIEDHSGQLCSKLFLESLFEHHPYGRLTTGSLESLGTINSAKLREFHRRWLNPKQAVVAVAGNLRHSDLVEWLDQLDAWTLSLPMAAGDTSVKVAEEAALRAPRWVERNLGREQQHIIVGGLGLHIQSEERHALRLLHNVLGGQSGRLFIELREKKSLAYTVSPLSMEGLERGYIGTYIACSPSKKDEALAGIRTVLTKLANQGPSAKEMSRAREFYLGRRAMELQSDSSRASSDGLQELYGLGHPPESEIIRRIQAVTAKDVRELCSKYLIEPHQVTSVVG